VPGLLRKEESRPREANGAESRLLQESRPGVGARDAACDLHEFVRYFYIFGAEYFISELRR
jgi:hypothetical protein